MKPVRLAPRFVTRVWGSKVLQPWFADRAEKTGEVWFSVSDSYPLLVKFLFTSENLSVQVHPNDDYARAHHNGSRGKSEMWHILRAELDAKVALGFQREIAAEELRAASLSGEIVELLRWIPVRAGETYLTPAGTVHAIGAGIVLCEIQQNSDVTYRLFDYHREPKRELHLDHGVKVAHLGCHPGLSLDEVRCEHFIAALLTMPSEQEYSPMPDELLIVLEGTGRLAGESFRAGEVWHMPVGTPPFRIEPSGTARLLRTFAP